MDNAAALAVVNGRLKKGEGWIGYRYSKNAHGERVQSKSLYFSFYQNGKQNTDDVREALIKVGKYKPETVARIG